MAGKRTPEVRTMDGLTQVATGKLPRSLREQNTVRTCPGLYSSDARPSLSPSHPVFGAVAVDPASQMRAVPGGSWEARREGGGRKSQPHDTLSHPVPSTVLPSVSRLFSSREQARSALPPGREEGQCVLYG